MRLGNRGDFGDDDVGLSVLSCLADILRTSHFGRQMRRDKEWSIQWCGGRVPESKACSDGSMLARPGLNALSSLKLHIH